MIEDTIANTAENLKKTLDGVKNNQEHLSKLEIIDIYSTATEMLLKLVLSTVEEVRHIRTTGRKHDHT